MLCHVVLYVSASIVSEVWPSTLREPAGLIALKICTLSSPAEVTDTTHDNCCSFRESYRDNVGLAGHATTLETFTRNGRSRLSRRI